MLHKITKLIYVVIFLLIFKDYFHDLFIANFYSFLISFRALLPHCSSMVANSVGFSDFLLQPWRLLLHFRLLEHQSSGRSAWLRCSQLTLAHLADHGVITIAEDHPSRHHPLLHQAIDVAATFVVIQVSLEDRPYRLSVAFPNLSQPS